MAASASSSLFQPLPLGGGSPITLKHRIVLAPLTRQRADEPSMAPRALSRVYYSQRATQGGLLVSEATNINYESCGYHHAPGIFTEDQVVAWRATTDAVHAKGGFIFCQLWHIGRVSHPSWADHPLLAAASKTGAAMPSVSASGVEPKGKTRNLYPEGQKGAKATPRALRTDEIPRLVADYRHAADCARRAGFDGVEVHGAHGYLLDQFLNSGTNRRTDAYGGSIANRCRLLFEVVRACLGVWGPGRVAVRLSPSSSDPKQMRFLAEGDDDPEALYAHAVAGLDALPLAYLQLTEPRWFGGAHDGKIDEDPGFAMPITNSVRYRPLYGGVLMAAGGFVPPAAGAAVRDGTLDLVGFGRWFISNPDLPARIKAGAPLNRYDRNTFYTYGEEGYTDYPSMDGAVGDASGKYATIEQGRIGKSLAQAKL